MHRKLMSKAWSWLKSLVICRKTSSNIKLYLVFYNHLSKGRIGSEVYGPYSSIDVLPDQIKVLDDWAAPNRCSYTYELARKSKDKLWHAPDGKRYYAILIQQE